MIISGHGKVCDDFTEVARQMMNAIFDDFFRQPVILIRDGKADISQFKHTQSFPVPAPVSPADRSMILPHGFLHSSENADTKTIIS